MVACWPRNPKSYFCFGRWLLSPFFFVCRAALFGRSWLKNAEKVQVHAINFIRQGTTNLYGGYDAKFKSRIAGYI